MRYSGMSDSVGRQLVPDISKESVGPICQGLEFGTHRLTRNSDNNQAYLHTPCKIPEERRSPLHRGESLKSLNTQVASSHDIIQPTQKISTIQSVFSTVQFIRRTFKLSLDNDQLDAHLLYFTISPLYSSTCFKHYMLIIRRLIALMQHLVSSSQSVAVRCTG